MFDDDLPQEKKTSEFPRNLESLSLDELSTYVTELKAEIARTESEIEKKKASGQAAAAFFK